MFNIFNPRKKTKIKRNIELSAYFLIIIGTIGFFGSAISAVGGLNWLSESFEWPIKYTNHAIKTATDIHIIPHSASGRIQLYDNNLKFVKGWHVDAHGGTFKIHLSKDNNLNVYTARGQWHYIFDLDGSLISKEKYTPETYDDFSGGTLNLSIPIAPWLIPFSHPFFSWCFIAAGIIVLITLDKKKKNKHLTKKST